MFKLQYCIFYLFIITPELTGVDNQNVEKPLFFSYLIGLTALATMDIKDDVVELKYDEFGETDDLQKSDVDNLKYNVFKEPNDLQHSDVENMETTEAVANGVDNKTCCKDKCLLMFDDEFKARLKSDLSTLSFLEKRIYLFAMISINEKKKNSGVKSKFFQYSVKEYGVFRPVCKIAFISIHNITQSTVRNLCDKMIDNQLIPTDKRGKHEKHPTIPESIKESIKTHLINTLESPDVS